MIHPLLLERYGKHESCTCKAVNCIKVVSLEGKPVVSFHLFEHLLCKQVLIKITLGITLWWTSIPSRGENMMGYVGLTDWTSMCF